MKLSDRFLTHRRLPLVTSMVVVLLASPALRTGWQFDDYLQRAMLTEHQGLDGLRVALMDLFIFMDGNPDHATREMNRGSFPWWTLPTAKEAFWRPASGLTHWLDYQLWPDQPLLMHAHSLLWFGALVIAVSALYRRFLGVTPVAGLATLLYALDDARGFGVAWLSNRNALCATLWGVLCLLAHERWRRTGNKRSVWLAAAFLALGLLSAEAAVATLAYLLAYAVFLDRGGWRKGLLALASSVSVVVVWRLGYRALGYGAWGTSYADPLTEPLRYGRAILARGPLLLLGQWALPPAEVAPFLEPIPRTLLWLVALLVLIALAWLLIPLLRRDRVARFWATGMLLAVLPSCAALPANRLLFFVGLGAMGLLGQLAVGDEKAEGRRQKAGTSWLSSFVFHLSSFPWQKPIMYMLAAIHLVLAPLLLPLTAFSPALLGTIEPSVASLPRDPDVTRRDLVIVNTPSFFSTGYTVAVRKYLHEPVPASTLLLAPNLMSLTLRRLDRNTLAVRPEGGYLLGFDTVFRGKGHPLRLGEQIVLERVRVEISDRTSDNRPAEAIFRFTVPLDDPSLQWLTWRAGRYESFALPPIGATVQLPATNPFAGER